MEDEKKLVQKCKKGDIESFELLIANHQKKIFNIAFRMLRNTEDASDIAQEVFLKAYKSISKFKETSSFSTWIYRIAVNTCIDEIRKRKKVVLYSLDSTIQSEDGELPAQWEDEGPRPDTIVENREMKSAVKKAVESLSEDHKTIIVLRDMDGFSYEEISELLDCSLGTVKSRINRARKALKDILLEQGELFDRDCV